MVLLHTFVSVTNYHFFISTGIEYPYLFSCIAHTNSISNTLIVVTLIKLDAKKANVMKTMAHFTLSRSRRFNRFYLVLHVAFDLSSNALVILITFLVGVDLAG